MDVLGLQSKLVLRVVIVRLRRIDIELRIDHWLLMTDLDRDRIGLARIEDMQVVQPLQRGEPERLVDPLYELFLVLLLDCVHEDVQVLADGLLRGFNTLRQGLN